MELLLFLKNASAQYACSDLARLRVQHEFLKQNHSFHFDTECSEK